MLTQRYEYIAIHIVKLISKNILIDFLAKLLNVHGRILVYSKMFMTDYK